MSLARRHARGPHFPRSLEWLLFTALEVETARGGSGSSKHKHQQHQAAGGTGPSSATMTPTAALAAAAASALKPSASPTTTATASATFPSPPQSLLVAAADLVRHFPLLFAEVVVSVARKTDAALWPPLFDAVGSPSLLLEGLVEAGELASAACFLLIIDRLEGAGAAQVQALRLMRASLRRGQYPLCCELLRFVVPPSPSETELEGAAAAARLSGAGPSGERACECV